ncbi:MAG: DUF881 domain-containing protein [Mycobacteriaceae bacterium]
MRIPIQALWRFSVPLVCLLAGILLATTREVSHGNELRRGDSARLPDLVREAEFGSAQAEGRRNDLINQVDRAQTLAAGTDSRVAQAMIESKTLFIEAGLTEVRGAGVTITLTDAPRDVDGKFPADASPDDLVVHQQDVQSVLNALWAGGAEAIQLQDQRITTGSAPRCVGNTLLLNGRTYSPPYVLKAIGDSAKLEAALEREPGVKVYRQYVTRFGLGYSQTRSNYLTVLANSQTPKTRYASVLVQDSP